jgi:AraC-like DNA-binding protein
MPARSATVAVVLPPEERARVEAAGDGCFEVVPQESIEAAAVAARERRLDAMFLSVHRCGDADLPRIARFVREFPQVPAVALVTRPDAGAVERVLRLGATGVRAVVDVSAPAGWDRLRELLREPSSPVAAAVMAALDPDLRGAPPDCRLFFEVLMRHAPELQAVTELCRTLRVPPSSFMSRFHRAGLPSPKVYLAHARLLHAAHLFRNTGLGITDVAHRLEYSSVQSFGRHLRTLMGITASEFRRRLPFDAAVARFRACLVSPFRARLLAFRPLGTMPGNHGHSAA